MGFMVRYSSYINWRAACKKAEMFPGERLVFTEHNVGGTSDMTCEVVDNRDVPVHFVGMWFGPRIGGRSIEGFCWS